MLLLFVIVVAVYEQAKAGGKNGAGPILQSFVL
jgi:hypothetical protein